ncbi:MAG: ABC transporter substrate-binding protein [Lautropia sp.]
MNKPGRMPLRCLLAGAFALLLLHGGVSAADLLRIGSPTAGSPNVAPIGLASELGYFSEVGLDVVITNFRGGSAAQESLLTGDSDIVSTGFGSLAQAVIRGVKNRCVAPQTDRWTGWALMLPPGSKVSDPRQLAGTRVGITAAGSLSDFLIAWTEKNYGIELDRVPLGTANLIQSAANSGQIQAFISWTPVVYSQLRENKARRLLDFGRDMPPQYAGCWAALDNVVDRNPEKMRKFAAVYLKALKHMKDNPEAATVYLMKFSSITDRRIADDIYNGLVASTLSGTMSVEPAMVSEALSFASLPALRPIQLFNDKLYQIAGSR